MSKAKLNKVLLGLSLSTLFFASNLKNCYAATVSFGTLSEGSTNSEVPYTPVEGQVYTSGKHRFEYGYNKKILSATGIDINGYDLNGTSVMPTSTTIDSTKYTFTSGTWIGINIIETQSVSWEVTDFTFKEIRKKYTCVYSKDSTKYECGTDASSTTIPAGSSCTKTGYTCTTQPIPANVSPPQVICLCTKPKYCTQNYNDITDIVYKDYYDEYSCDATKTDNNGVKYSLNTEKSSVEEITNDTVDTTQQNLMKQEARNTVHSEALSRIGAPVGEVKYIKNNDYPSNGIFDKGELTGRKLTETDSGAGRDSGSATKSYEYRQEKVCMNLKNAKITYGEDCDSDEIRIPNKTVSGSNLTYWHYFIPLNAKSGTEEFYLEIIGNVNRKLSIDECKDAMKKYSSNYPDYIIPNLTGGEFDLGNSKKYNEELVETNGGCYFATTIYIPTIQKFYNEIDSNGTKKFKGFNFYYKPINVTDPFPNGIPTISIWTEEDTSDLTGPTLSSDDITYIANVNNNVYKIRNYNKTIPYTTWDNMYISGKSKFIENEGIVDRYVDTTDFYKLGCGPANSSATNSDGKTNYLYQQECGTQ